MSSDSVTPPPVEEQIPGQTATPPPSAAAEAPPIQFSFMRWATTGVIRLLYRRWTRIAVRLFPENSKSEQIARALHFPLPDQLNMSWITNHLAVGGRIRPEDIPALSEVGVTHVVDTRAEYCDDKEALAAANIDLLYLPTPDTYPLSIEQLMEGAAWANERISQGGRIVIHCEHGVGRSALLACSTLVYGGMNASDALELVKEKRWQAGPNRRQVVRLMEFESAFRAQRSAATHIAQ